MIRVNITVDREPRQVWSYITRPETWEGWWGGALSGAQPGWQTGGSLVWGSGDTTPIDSLIPNKLLRIKAGPIDITLMLVPGDGATTVVEMEESDFRDGGGYEDGGAAQQTQYQAILQRLKAGIEAATPRESAPAAPSFPPAGGPSQPPAPLSVPPQSAGPPMPPAPASLPPISVAPIPSASPSPAASGMETFGAGSPGEAPTGAAPAPADPSSADDDLAVSNTGTKVAAIVVVVIIIAAVVGVLVFLQRKQAEVEKHEAVKAAFQTAHNKGYVEFWKKVQVDVKGMKSNTEFEARLRQVTSDPVRYAKHIKENGLPIIDNAMADYKAIAANAPGEYDEYINALVTAMENLRTEWAAFASEYVKFEDFGKANEKLETASSHWLGWQQTPGTEKWKYNAVKYVKVLRCIFGPKPQWKDFEYTMETEVTNTCAKAAEKPEWFRRVAFECLPKLMGGPAEADEDFEAAVAAFKDSNDTTSKLGIDTCLKKSRPDFESEAIGKLGKPWADYVKAQNALLEAIDTNLEKLK